MFWGITIDFNSNLSVDVLKLALEKVLRYSSSRKVIIKLGCLKCGDACGMDP